MTNYILLVALFILQMVWPGIFLTVPFLLYLTLSFNRRLFIFAFLTGLFTDMFFSSVFGFYTVIFMAISFIASEYHVRFFSARNPISLLPLILISYILIFIPIVGSLDRFIAYVVLNSVVAMLCMFMLLRTRNEEFKETLFRS